MSTFTVVKKVDAWVKYELEIDAASPEEAKDLAEQADHEEWEQADTQQFDHAEYFVKNEDGVVVLGED